MGLCSGDVVFLQRHPYSDRAYATCLKRGFVVLLILLQPGSVLMMDEAVAYVDEVEVGMGLFPYCCV
jgi:hypothetical protein